jgi:hypothetical protein
MPTQSSWGLSIHTMAITIVEHARIFQDGGCQAHQDGLAYKPPPILHCTFTGDLSRWSPKIYTLHLIREVEDGLRGKNRFENHPTSGHVDFFFLPKLQVLLPFCPEWAENLVSLGATPIAGDQGNSWEKEAGITCNPTSTISRLIYWHLEKP